MKVEPKAPKCAVYTRVSSDSGLEQDFNSLDAQREAAEAYIKSQAHEGWRLVRDISTTAAFPVDRWSARRFRSYWTASGIDVSTSWSSIKSTVSRAPSRISPSSSNSSTP